MDKKRLMRIHNALDKILNHEVKTKILRILCKYGTEWTGRQLAKELKVSPTTANKFLKELVDEGIINIKGAGKAYLYSLNDRNYTVKNLLKPFFEREKDIFNAIVSLIKNAILEAKVRIESAVIFGSIAQKKEMPRSDVDLLIILNNPRDKKKIEDKLDKISTIAAQSFETTISPYILSTNQFKKRYKKKMPIIREILKSYILIIGKPIERLII